MKIVVLAQQGRSTNILLNWLDDNGYDKPVVFLEAPPSRWQQLRFRRRRLGSITVLGQLAFVFLALPVLRRHGKERYRQILAEHKLKDTPLDQCLASHVCSVNDEEVRTRLREIGPDVVLVNGTRIISRDTLAAISAPFLNIHAGITPGYRGVHGGYWALYANDPSNCGVTLHLVDVGVDTGPILGQRLIVPEARDNFTTYPLLQQAAAFPLLATALESVHAGLLLAHRPEGQMQSRQWYHPTIFQYLVRRFKGIK